MQASIISAAFVAGLLSFFSPCILPLLPVYIGLLTTDAGNNELGAARRAANTVAFVLGISTTFFLLGLGAGAVGRTLNNPYISITCGLVIFLFGLHLSGFMTIPILVREKRMDLSKINASTVVGAFLLGLGFSFGWTPCIGPILGSILALAAQQGTAIAGAALTLVYSLGMCIPFLIITLASNALIDHIRKLHRFMPVIQRVGGVLIAIMGLWMMFMQVHELASYAPKANMSASQQQAETQAEVEAANTGETDANASSNPEADAWRNITFEDINGEQHQIADFEGAPVYIEFWGSWCPNCMDNIEEFKETAARHNEAGDVQVISIAVPGRFGEMEKAEFIDWCNEQGYDFPILLDENAELIAFFNISGFPTSVFVDARGKVQLVLPGVIEPEELEGLFASLEDTSGKQ